MDALGNELALSRIAGAIAEPARTKMLCSLMDGHARTSTEMAVIAEVSTSTASAHLARLKDDGLIQLHTQGRHRYYSLANTQVAQALEALMVVSQSERARFISTAPDRLQFARTCYDHMAGTLAVRLHDCFIGSGWLIESGAGDRLYALTESGQTVLKGLGIDIDKIRSQRRRFACACLDWSMRRPHLGGALGAALLQAALSRKWVIQNLDNRALTLTVQGQKALFATFGLTFENQGIAERGPRTLAALAEPRSGV